MDNVNNDIFKPLKCCVICDSENIDLFTESKWDIWESEFNNLGITYKMPKWSFCKNCSHVFLNPRFSEKFEEKLYGKESIYRKISRQGKSISDYMSTIDNTVDGKAKFHKTHYETLKKVLKIIGSKRKLKFLDFGAGWGSCSTSAEYLGLDYRGLEIDNWCLSQAEKLNRNVKNTFNDFENLDLLYSLQVFEHINNPRKVLEEFIHKMKKGSYIFTNVPTYEFNLFKNWSVGGLDSLNWFHCHSYSTKSLIYLFELYGFEEVRTWLDKGDVNVLMKKTKNKNNITNLRSNSILKKKIELKIHSSLLVKLFKLISLPKKIIKFFIQ